MNSVLARLFRLPYMLLMGPIKGRAHRRYLGQLDALVKLLADRFDMDDEGLVCIFGGPGTCKGRVAHRLRLHTSVPCFDEIRDPVVADNWRQHYERSGGRIAFVTVQSAGKEEAEILIRSTAQRMGIGLPFSIYFVALPSMAESWGKPVVPGASTPSNTR